MSSDFLFNKFSRLGYVIIANFSFEQSIHFFDMFEYAGACLIRDHLISGVASVVFFLFQMCLAILVLFMYLRLLNDVLCTELLGLNGPSVAPIYALLVCTTSPWYTRLEAKQFPLSGQSILLRQLHVMGGVTFVVETRLF